MSENLSDGMYQRKRITKRSPFWSALLTIVLFTGCRGIWCGHRMKYRAENHPGIVWECSVEGLDGRLLNRLCRVADDYLEKTNRAFVITSGRRTLRHQASLMAEMSREQLEGMYCRNGYPSYIHEILELRKSNPNADAEDTYRILSQRTEGYISSHLYGGAVDIAAEGTDTACIKDLLKRHGFRVLDEQSLGIDCIHATCRKVPQEIIHE